MAHRRRRQIAQRVVVGALPLDAAEAEPLRGEPAGEPVARARTRPGRAPCTVRGRSPARPRPGYSSSAARRNDVKCAASSTSITVPVGRCTSSTGSRRFSRAACSTERSPLSRAEDAARAPRAPRSPGRTSAGSRRALATRSRPTWPCSHSQSNDALLENDPVLRRRRREGRVDAAGRHGAIVASNALAAPGLAVKSVRGAQSRNGRLRRPGRLDRARRGSRSGGRAPARQPLLRAGLRDDRRSTEAPSRSSRATR